jgi:deoxycytidylate deaminase
LRQSRIGSLTITTSFRDRAGSLAIARMVYLPSFSPIGETDSSGFSLRSNARFRHTQIQHQHAFYMTTAESKELTVDNRAFFGITSAVGTPLDLSANALCDELRSRHFEAEQIRFSKLSSLIKHGTETFNEGTTEFRNVRNQMEQGNEARRISGRNDILALLAISKVVAGREAQGDPDIATAVLFRQLKEPEEAYLLRHVYDEGFHLVGVYCPLDVRLQQLQTQKGMTPVEARSLTQIDADEGKSFGQHVRDTFHLSDVFVRATGDAVDAMEVRQQLKRYCELLFGDGFHTPTIDEYGMFLAWASGLRSGQLSRQVGAAILTRDGDVLSVGTNEVPRGGGGQYWEDSLGPDGRDHLSERGDSTDYMRRDMLREILDVLKPNWRTDNIAEDEKAIMSYQQQLRGTRVMNLTEFTRAVHAEMESLCAAVRTGTSVKGATLYTTTFPCHNCTKHIVAAGIRRVVYIEPYPKSMAYDLHQDSINIDKQLDESNADEARKVDFQAFVGIAPRRYSDLFAMTTKEGNIIRRKDKLGVLLSSVGSRLRLQIGSYMDREALAVSEVSKIVPN